MYTRHDFAKMDFRSFSLNSLKDLTKYGGNEYQQIPAWKFSIFVMLVIRTYLSRILTKLL